MELKLTPWFTANQKPVRAGVYQVLWFYNRSNSPRNAPLIYYSYWDGEKWLPTAPSIEKALAYRDTLCFSFTQNKNWRGILTFDSS